MSCEIILVLHAPTDWNLEGRCQGHVDTPLCEQGREAAIALAHRLSSERIDAIYSSDLRRARPRRSWRGSKDCISAPTPGSERAGGLIRR